MDTILHVYAVTATGRYAGGIAIVAAQTIEEALHLASQIRGNMSWRVHYGRPEGIKPLEAQSMGTPRVLVFYEYGE